MNDAKKSEKLLITAEDAIETLREKVADETLAPSRMALSVGELRDLLDKVKPGKLGQGNYQFA
jgi:hypothetical protein